MNKDSYIYILSNYANTVIYIGVTSDLEKRVYQHKMKLVDGFTKLYYVDKLVYYEVYGCIEDAIEREKQLKKRKRAYKDELINAFNTDWLDLYEGLFGKVLKEEPPVAPKE